MIEIFTLASFVIMICVFKTTAQNKVGRANFLQEHDFQFFKLCLRKARKLRYFQQTIGNGWCFCNTRPKLPFGRQGLAGSWSKDTVGQVHFKVFSMSNFATHSSVFLELNFAFLQHIQSTLRHPKKNRFFRKSPKLWVGGGQES